MPKSQKPDADDKTPKVEHSPPQWWQHAVGVLLLGVILVAWVMGFITLSLVILSFALVATVALIFLLVIVWRVDSIKQAFFEARRTKIGFETHDISPSLKKSRQASDSMKRRTEPVSSSKFPTLPRQENLLKRTNKKRRRN